MTIAIKKNDEVVVLAGKNTGTRAKVLRVLPKGNRLIVEGVNVGRRRERPRRAGQKGQVVLVPLPLDRSNAALWCARCNRGVRYRTVLQAKVKTRVCHRCGQKI